MLVRLKELVVHPNREEVTLRSKDKHIVEVAFVSAEKSGSKNFTSAFKASKAATNTGPGTAEKDAQKKSAEEPVVTIGQQFPSRCVCKSALNPKPCEGTATGVKVISCGEKTHEPSDCSPNAIPFCTCDPCGSFNRGPDGCGNHIPGPKD